MSDNKIHKRGLTSFFTLFGFIIMSVTGLVLYIVPAGRVAYWTTWEMISLTKTDWGNIHILSSVLFIIAGGFHTYYNWKPLMSYFKDKTRKGVKLQRELIISSVLSIWIVVGAIWPHPPLSYLLDFNEWIKDSWVIEDAYEPPFGHAELLSFKNFTKKMDIDITKASDELKANGIKFESVEETLEDIGKNNDISPMNIYLLIKKFEPVPETEVLETLTPDEVIVKFSGTGFGKKSVAYMCERIGLDTTVALQRLQTAGIDVNFENTMKETAEAHNTEAIDIMKVLLIEGHKIENDDES